MVLWLGIVTRVEAASGHCDARLADIVGDKVEFRGVGCAFIAHRSAAPVDGAQ